MYEIGAGDPSAQRTPRASIAPLAAVRSAAVAKTGGDAVDREVHGAP
jgi:hypothetical protein